MTDATTPEIVKELALTRKQLQVIRNVLEELNKVSGLKHKLDQILGILDEQFGINHSYICMPDDARTTLSVFAHRGNVSENETIAFGKGIAGMAAQKEKPINITGLRRKMHYINVMQGNAVTSPVTALNEAPESQVAIPLLSGNTLVAVLVAESERSSVFSLADEQFLLTLTTPIAVSIQNAMLFDTMESKISERTAELQQLNHTRDKLFSIISHDLRSPVTSFQSIAQLLNHYIKKGDIQKIANMSDHIDQSATRLNMLLDNLLNWSLGQQQAIRVEIVSVRLKHFIEEIAGLYHDALSSKNIVPAISIPGELHVLFMLLFICIY